MAPATPSPSTDWLRLLGSSGQDLAYDIAVAPDGRVYVCGTVAEALGAGASAQGSGSFLAAYDRGGSLLALTRIGDSGTILRDLSLGDDGSVYLTGASASPLNGVQVAGGFDAVLLRFDDQLNHQWTRFVGGADNDFGKDVAFQNRVLEGRIGDLRPVVYMAGSGIRSFAFAGGPSDAFVRGFGTDGSQVLQIDQGTPHGDEFSAVAVSAAALVIGGGVSALPPELNKGAADGLVVSYNIDGSFPPSWSEL